MTASFNKFNCFALNLGLKSMNLSVTDVFKVCLVSVQPVATWTTKASLTQVANGNGYTTDGNSCAITSWSLTGGTAKWVLVSPTLWTCATAPMGPFQWAVLMDTTSNASQGDLIGWWDYGVSCTLQIGDTFTITFGADVIELA